MNSSLMYFSRSFFTKEKLLHFAFKTALQDGSKTKLQYVNVWIAQFKLEKVKLQGIALQYVNLLFFSAHRRL